MQNNYAILCLILQTFYNHNVDFMIMCIILRYILHYTDYLQFL